MSDRQSISCPTCRENQILPEGGAECLPNSFHVISLLELKEKLIARGSDCITCSKHNYPLKVYCETCNEVICSECAVSKEHKKHDFEKISECYPKHLGQIQTNLNLMKHKTADLNEAVTALLTREREVVEMAEQAKKEIHTYAQQLIDQVKKSEEELVEEVNTVVQQKRHLLTKQREQTERMLSQLKLCEEMVEHHLKEWDQQQIMIEKESLLKQIKTTGQDIEPTVFQPLEEADTKFTRVDIYCDRIGTITSNNLGKASLKPTLCLSNGESNSTLVLQSNNGSPFSPPHMLISCKSKSPGDGQCKDCDVRQTQPGEYSISFSSGTSEHCVELIVQVGGVDISGSPFTVPVIPSSVKCGTPVKTIAGLSKPYGAAVCGNGEIVVAEYGTHCVTVVDREGEKVRSFGNRGTKEGEFTYPRGVAVSNDNHIFITDDHRLQKFTFQGEFVKSVGSSGRGSGQLQFYRPRGIVIHPTTREVYVADTGNNRIEVFDNNLNFVKSLTLDGGHQFLYPCGLALDSEDCLYATEWSDHRITKFLTTGEYVARFSSKGSEPGQLNRPYDLVVVGNFIYVSEVSNHRVSIFDREGTFLHCFCQEGGEIGELKRPYGITASTGGGVGSLYVSDTHNNRLVVF